MMSGCSGSEDRISVLTAQHLRKIVASLRDKETGGKVDSSRSGVSAEALTKEFVTRKPQLPTSESKLFEIGGSKAERAGRALLLSGGNEPKGSQWWVFSQISVDKQSAGNIFRLSAQLPELEKAHRFVAACYEIILERPADDEGLMLYVSLLKTKKLTEKGLIKILLTSNEGMNINGKIVFIRYPCEEIVRFDNEPMQDKYIKLKPELYDGF